MYLFKIKLPYNEENFFGTKTESLNVKFTLHLAKLNMVCSRLLSNSLFFSYEDLFHCYLILGTKH